MPASYYDQAAQTPFNEDLLRTLPQGSNPNAMTVDQVNIAMRNSPVWNSWMQQRGIDTQNVHLSNSDKNGLAKTLELAGFPLPDGWEIDDSGNIREETHVGRNILIAAAIAGAAFGGYAVLSAYGASAGAGAGAAEGAAAAGGVEAGTAAGLGGVEAGATAGLGADAAAGTLGSAAAGSAELGAGVAGAGAADAAGGAFDAAGNYIGPEGTVAGETSGGSTLGTIGNALKNPSTYRALGSAIGQAGQASGQNRLTNTNLGLQANQQNISGQSAYEAELLNRAKLEEGQRATAQRNLYKASVARNPRVSPFDPTGGPKYSADYLSAMDALSGQGKTELSSAPTYDASKLPQLAPYRPIDPKDVQGATGNKKGTWETIGDWVGPALSTYGAFSQYY